MTQELAGCIAVMVLKHPLIRGSQRQLGTVVHREELTKLLMHLASHPEPQKANGLPLGPDSVREKVSLKEKMFEVLRNLIKHGGIDEPARRTESLAALRQLLKENGIEDPAKTLENVRALALQLEKSNPELTNNARHNLAILH